MGSVAASVPTARHVRAELEAHALLTQREKEELAVEYADDMDRRRAAV